MSNTEKEQNGSEKSTPSENESAEFNSWELNTTKKVTFQWMIKNFNSCPKVVGQRFDSPLFPTSERPQWRLQISPGGDNEESKEYISLAVILVSSKSSTVADAHIKFSILGSKGKSLHEMFFKDSVEKGIRIGYSKFVNRGILMAKEKGFIVNDTLTISCEITTASNGSSQPVEMETTAPHQYLTDDLGPLLDNKTFCDVSIFVENVEFQAHKLILAARSPVMAALFQQQMKDNRTDVVTLDDITHQIFGILLRFIYTGRVETLEGNAEDLLSAANKYQLEHLKMMCEEELFRKLTSGNAVHILQLADAHQALQLKDQTIDFINGNAVDIIQTGEWNDMVKSQPHLVADIYVKAIDLF